MTGPKMHSLDQSEAHLQMIVAALAVVDARHFGQAVYAQFAACGSISDAIRCALNLDDASFAGTVFFTALIIGLFVRPIMQVVRRIFGSGKKHS